jgi:hypothetical protein
LSGSFEAEGQPEAAGSVDQELAPVPRIHEIVEGAWATDDIFLTPESVVKDPVRPVLDNRVRALRIRD